MQEKVTPFGIEITEYPFEGESVNEAMFIRALVKGRNMSIWFSGTTTRHPLKVVNATQWTDSFRRVFARAKEMVR
jgi:hypothetical protein